MDKHYKSLQIMIVDDDSYEKYGKIENAEINAVLDALR